MVRMEGVEPPRLSALDPKSSASANSATSAICGVIVYLLALQIKGEFAIKQLLSV